MMLALLMYEIKYLRYMSTFKWFLSINQIRKKCNLPNIIVVRVFSKLVLPNSSLHTNFTIFLKLPNYWFILILKSIILKYIIVCKPKRYHILGDKTNSYYIKLNNSFVKLEFQWRRMRVKGENEKWYWKE